MKIRILLAGALLLGALSTTVASASTDGCSNNTQQALLAIGPFYVYQSYGLTIYYELWQESNDLPGLQRGTTRCDEIPDIPPDTCITHTVTISQIRCVTEYPVPG